MGAVDSMRKLVKNLPKGDQNLAHTFLDNRDFESLYELISSAIYITRNNLKKSSPKQEYLDADVTGMNVFKSELSLYMDKIGIIDNINDDNEEEMNIDEED